MVCEHWSAGAATLEPCEVYLQPSICKGSVRSFLCYIVFRTHFHGAMPEEFL